MKLKVVALLVVGAVLETAQVYAHHAGTAEFDIKKSITIQGTIARVELTNPHGWIYVNVKGPDGKVKTYSVQTSSPGSLMRRGVNRKDLAIGNAIVVDGWPSRDGSNSMNGQTIKTADGKSITGAND